MTIAEDQETREIMKYWKKRETQIIEAMETKARLDSPLQSPKVSIRKKVRAKKTRSAPVSPKRESKLKEQFIGEQQIHQSSSQIENLNIVREKEPQTVSLESLAKENEQLDYYAKQGIHLFNTTPIYGVQYLLSHFFEFSDLPCLFFDYRYLVDSVRLGLWIADNPSVLAKYLSMYNFKNQMPVQALSELIKYVQPARGTKVLTTFLRAFVAKYIHDNKTFPLISGSENCAIPYTDAYEIYTLLYASIMVHSEYALILSMSKKKAHSKQYWTQAKFVKGIRDLTKIPTPYVTIAYRSVMEGLLIITDRTEDIEEGFREHRRIITFDNIKSEMKSPIDHETTHQERYFEKSKDLYDSKANMSPQLSQTSANSTPRSLDKDIFESTSKLTNKPVLSLNFGEDLKNLDLKF